MIAAPAAPPAAVAAVQPSDAACMRAIRRAPHAKVDARCWRVGPLRIGMARAEVEARLGPPDVADEVADDVRGARRVEPHAVYVFPRDLAQRLARRPEPSLHIDALELTYFDGRLVRIGNGPPVRGSGPACARHETEPEPPRVADESFRPFQRFLGMRVGDRLSDVRRDFGRWWSISRGGDFINFFRIPVTLGVDEDPPTLRKRVDNFAVGSDEFTVYGGGWVDVELDLAPTTCRVRGFHFVPPRGDG